VLLVAAIADERYLAALRFDFRCNRLAQLFEKGIIAVLHEDPKQNPG
jgi:hypothetical protein